MCARAYKRLQALPFCLLPSAFFLLPLPLSSLLAVEDDAEDDGFDGAEFFLGEEVLTLADEGLQFSPRVGAAVEPLQAFVDRLVDARRAVAEHGLFLAVGLPIGRPIEWQAPPHLWNPILGNRTDSSRGE